MVAYQIRVGAFKTYDHNLTVFHIAFLIVAYQIRVGAYQIRIGCIPNTNECVNSASRITNHFWRRICFLVNIGVFTKFWFLSNKLVRQHLFYLLSFSISFCSFHNALYLENDDLDISSSLQHSSTVAFGFLSRYSYTQSCISLEDFLFFLLVQKS